MSDNSTEEWEDLDDRHLALFQALEKEAKKRSQGVKQALIDILQENGVDSKDLRFSKELRALEEREAELSP